MTNVTFPAGDVAATASVTEVLPAGGVITDLTPFHPVDHTWPDQPADTGIIEGDAVSDAVMAARSPEGEWLLASNIPVKRGAEGWEWAVAHIVRDAERFTVGQRVHLSVDAGRRHALSVGHTACHLASLALNAALQDYWSKDARFDALGRPDFDGTANQRSRIVASGARDEFRLGKSLRKKGFDTARLLDSLPELQGAVNRRLDAWIATAAAVRITTEGPRITDVRRWECELPEGTASIACGGTHVTSLAELGSVSVTLTADDPQLLVMETSATG
ncbi:MAG TPA: hypothetical protein H9830_15515 [Candidatus Agrococcus pullicola]|uniref:Metal-dependent hydrolase n=1 Tax=Candidatus Agrococcus pullicola TaxID=2838429 RepID=A0A9D1YXP7_9MICO|nr:hypothetical protein [Candidatus Agrococcus pullicola]